VRYVGRRFADSLLLLLALSVLSFAFAQLAPGDYFSELRTDPRISADTVAGLRARAGLDRPFPVRYANWVRSVARGDFGYSLAYNGPVAPLLWQRIRGTLLLTATAAAESGWFPAGGMASAGFAEMSGWTRVRDLVWHLALPVAVLVLGMLPVLVRHVRASMLEVIDSPFALSARAHGIRHRRLLFRHLLPVAMNPLVSMFGFSLGTLLSASLLVEVVMGWPGLGPLFLEAIVARDFALVLAVVMCSATFLVAANLISDLLLYRLDPRIRTE
jgi:peptide/nickel transport system permease protein